MGSIKGHLDALAGRIAEAQAAATEEEDLERQRLITRMILDEFARLKASGEFSEGDPLAQAVRNVAADQYADLGEENYRYIADGWTQTLKEWTRLDWLAKAGREGPPSL
jgi:3-methyladenine DNA glycosylase AlkD